MKLEIGFNPWREAGHMGNSSLDPDSLSPRDMLMLRLSILIGGVLISMFMIGDLQLVPEELSQVYFNNRAFVQIPMILALLGLTFHHRFQEFAQAAFFFGVLAVTYANYYLILVCWEREGFSFPYEGTLLYAFFGFFVLGMKFRYALWLMLLSSAGFIGLMLMNPVYGDLTFMNVGFVLGSLFIGVIGRHRLDLSLGRLNDANEQLLALSSIDALSDLLNRRAFTNESERFFELQRRSGQSLAVFMMDLDHFKQFNDHYGHQEGDRAIRCQADIMKRVFKRQTDLLGRYGGEEFIAITMEQDSSDVQRQAAEILNQWKEPAVPFQDSSGDGLLSCSIGVCQGRAADFASVDDMIRLADQALYRAKNEGRARFVLAKT